MNEWAEEDGSEMDVFDDVVFELPKKRTVHRGRVVERAASRTPEGAPHAQACDSGRCPCYVHGQEDLALAIRTLQRHGLPIDAVLSDAEAKAPGQDSRPRH